MNKSKTSLRRLFVIATITLLSLSALLGIIFVLTGADVVAWKVCGTVAILGILSLIAMSNIFRFEGSRLTIKVLSVVAIVAAVVWAFLLIGTIWDVYRSIVCEDTYRNCSRFYSDLMQDILKIIVTGVIVSVTTTVIGAFLQIKNHSSILAVFKYTAIASAVFLGVYFLPAIWLEDGDYIEDSWRLMAVVGIVFAFTSIVTPIVSKVQKAKSLKGVEAKETPVDEAKLRQEIEAEVRAKIASEQSAKSSKK